MSDTPSQTASEHPILHCWEAGPDDMEEAILDDDQEASEMSSATPKQTARTPGQHIIAALTEVHRAVVLKNAVYDLDGFEMTDQEAIEVLVKIDAVDPLRQEHSHD